MCGVVFGTGELAVVGRQLSHNRNDTRFCIRTPYSRNRNDAADDGLHTAQRDALDIQPPTKVWVYDCLERVEAHGKAESDSFGGLAEI